MKQPEMNPLSTRFSAVLDPENLFPEYPRPMLRRKTWYNLNGFWNYAVTKSQEEPILFDGQILVPFSPECALSGVRKKILPDDVLWYQRSLPAVTTSGRQRILLHFGAVDQHAWVYVNGTCVGEHHGGYLPFSCDITEAVCQNQTAPFFPTQTAKTAHTHTAAPSPSKPYQSAGTSESPHCKKPVSHEIPAALPGHSVQDPSHDSFNGTESARENTLTVKVIDLTDTSYHSRGKQKLQPSGMYYTAQSGIWQTVWMEIVPENHITRIAYLPDYDHAQMKIKLLSARETPVTYTIYEAALYDSADIPLITSLSAASVSAETASQTDGREMTVSEENAPSAGHFRPLLSGSAATNRAFAVTLPDFQPWSPENPVLYTVVFETAADRVQSYFAMRKCSVQKDASDIPRLFLNNRPYFQTGLLDQGYYPESLYTPPSDEALISDIQSAKRLGFNMLRKHAKLEPDRFYYHCDRLGMLVWQDMVNGGSTYLDWYITYLATALNHVHIHMSDRWRCLLSRGSADGRREFISEVQDTIRTLGSHPSIVVWVPFNEGWGQFDTLKICEGIKKMDPSRPVDHASGWFDQRDGDIQSIHYYFFQYNFKPDGRRAMALTEYGSYSYSIPGHCVNLKEYGYQKYTSTQELTAAFRRLVTDTLLPSIREGLSAAIFTQLTDIEGETNGVYTYDREICKLDEEIVKACNRKMREAGDGILSE